MSSSQPATSQPATSQPRVVVALSADLMDRSKISGAFPDAILVRSLEKLAQAATTADLVLVDLNRVDDPAALEALPSRVIAFGSHVDGEQLAAAERSGVEAMARSLFFRRLETGEL